MTIATNRAAPAPRAMTWAGWTLTGIVTAFLVMDGAMKVLRLPVVLDTTAQLGFPVSGIFGLGLVILAIAVLYAAPTTAVLGAVLMTGLYGGTVAVHILAGNPLASHVLFGVYLGVAAWGGLWLRDARVRALLPVRR